MAITPTRDHTRQGAAEVAEYIVARYREGYRGALILGGISFELTDVARCSEFVREVTECSAGTGDHSLPYWGATARGTEHILALKGKRVLGPARGFIVCFNRGAAGEFGHIGLCLGDGRFAENTSSTSRGPGFVVSKLAQMEGRISGYYSVLPGRQAVAPPPQVPRLVTLGGTVVCEGRMIDGHLWTPTRDTLRAVGADVSWHEEQSKGYIIEREG